MNEYKLIKNWSRLVVSLIYWAASMIFFVVGFSFSNPIVIFGTDISVPLAVALSLANTVIQVSGNGDDDKDWIDNVIWIASYALGISTNYIGLTMLLNMGDPKLEMIVSASLGTMIEILPERMLVKFLKEYKPFKKSNPVKTPQGKFNRPAQSNARPQFGKQITPDMLASIKPGGKPPWERE